MPLVNAFANNAPTDLADYYRRGLEQAQQSVTQAAAQAPARAQMPLADVIARLAAMGITDLSQLVGKSDAELMQMATGAVGAGTAAPTGAAAPGAQAPPGGPSAFVRDFGATPQQLYEHTMQKIQAAGLYPTSGEYPAKTAGEWYALFRQFGGEPAAAAYAVMSGQPSATRQVAGSPTSGPSVQPDQISAIADRYFTGVVGTTGGPGQQGGEVIYQVYRDGQLLASVPGSGTTDTAALGEQFGLDSNGWYGAATPHAPVGAQAATGAQPIGAQTATGAQPVSAQPAPGAQTAGGVTLTPAQLQARATAVPQVQQYVSNLSGVAQPTAAQTADLAMYQQRLGDYQASAGLIQQPTLTAAQLAARAAAVPQVQTYISNLSKVAQPTAAQSAELAMYQQRLADYQKSASLIQQPVA